MSSYNDIIEKIKKLLALSESSNPNEAALAQARAAELMLKYSIGQGQINFSEKKEDEPINVFLFEADEGNKTTWKGNLASSIARFFNCKIYWQGPNLMFIGRDSDKNAVLYLYKAIFNQIQELTELFWIKEGIRSGIHGKTWKQSFRLGCVSTLAIRFAEQKNTLIQEYKQNGTSLALYDQLAYKVDQRASKLNLQVGSPISAKSSSAFHSGSQAAKSINIGGNASLNSPSSGIGNQAFRLTNKG